nr:glycosyltransferase family 2 protein [Oceanococcus sp. HetDA_MAG_MS8]
MMTPPEQAKVTVIIPTHNRAHLLRRSVMSVLGQTHRDIELIVIDDASTDATPEVLGKIDDSRLTVLRNTQNHGAAAARNKGIAIASGQYLCFQDDDDYWLAEKIQRQLQALEKSPGTRWCLAAYVRLTAKGAVYVGGSFYEKQVDYTRGIGHGGPEWSLITTPNWLVETALIREVGGFDERIHSWDDWELSLRIRNHTDFVHVNAPLWIQDRVDGGGLTKAERARADDMRLILVKHGAMWTGRPDVMARHYYVIGRAESLYDDRPGAGRDMIKKSLRVRPIQIKAWVALLLSYIGQSFTKSTTMFLRRWRERVNTR